jgi:hypothetical protein
MRTESLIPLVNRRTIDLNSYTDTASLKMLILQKLLLVDPKRDSVAEFDDRLKTYLGRNGKLQLVFRVDRDKIERDLRFQLSLAANAQPYPENYEFGNPLNRWMEAPVARTAEERERLKVDLEEAVQASLMALRDFLNGMQLLGSGNVVVEDR